jgi:hypothetical protein
MPSAAPRLAGRGGRGISKASLPEHIPGPEGLHLRVGSAADGGIETAEPASLVSGLRRPIRIPRPNDGLALCLQLRQLQVEIEQNGQPVILDAPVVVPNSSECKLGASDP